MSDSPYQPRRLVRKRLQPVGSSNSPYAPRALTKETIVPAKELKSSGYPPDDSLLSKLNTVKEIKAANAILKELDVETSAVEIVKLLKDEKRLNEVVRKLKLKAFW